MPDVPVQRIAPLHVLASKVARGPRLLASRRDVPGGDRLPYFEREPGVD
jgi:hypothetical protein